MPTPAMIVSGVGAGILSLAWLAHRHPATTIGAGDRAPSVAEMSRDMDWAARLPKPRGNIYRHIPELHKYDSEKFQSDPVVIGPGKSLPTYTPGSEAAPHPTERPAHVGTVEWPIIEVV